MDIVVYSSELTWEPPPLNGKSAMQKIEYKVTITMWWLSMTKDKVVLVVDIKIKEEIKVAGKMAQQFRAYILLFQRTKIVFLHGVAHSSLSFRFRRN